jgi:branched-chain amino acid aminotransferase
MKFDKLCKVIFLKNKYVSSSKANFHILSHSLHFASSVFEGIRVYNKVPFYLNDHLKRLENSCKIMDLELPFPKESISKICNEIIKKNKIKDGYLRPIIFRGTESMSPETIQCSTILSISGWSWNKLYGQKNVSLIVSKWRKPNPNISPVAAKSSGSYQISTLAKNYALKKGFDDALMLDVNENICESSSCNIFWVKDKKVFTPTTISALEGITRKIVINILKKNKIKVKIGDFKLAHIYEADEAFLTGTASEIVGIEKINKKKYKNFQFIKLIKSKFEKLKND